MNELVFLWPFVCGCTPVEGGNHVKINFHGSSAKTFREMLVELGLDKTEYPANYDESAHPLIVPEPIEHAKFE